jgi:hypothetical protein
MRPDAVLGGSAEARMMSLDDKLSVVLSRIAKVEEMQTMVLNRVANVEESLTGLKLSNHSDVQQSKPHHSLLQSRKSLKNY